MMQLIGSVTNRVADYTIGTIIVMVHIALVDRRRGAQRALSQPSQSLPN